MTLLDGKAVAKKIQEELKEKIKNEPRKPILTVIMVESEKSGPSQIYVRNKIKRLRNMTYHFLKQLKKMI